MGRVQPTDGGWLEKDVRRVVDNHSMFGVWKTSQKESDKRSHMFLC